MRSVESLIDLGATLGEGPAWIDGALWFVDIKQHKVHRYTPDGAALHSWDAPGQIGWVLPSAEGGFLAGLQDGLHRFDPATGAFDLLAAVEPDLPGNRLNDATTDGHGRLWFGSMDDAETADSGCIYRADASGIARMVSGISITNGPAFCASRSRLYHNDTLGKRVFVSLLDEDGTIHDTRLFAEIDDGYPDGPVVDAEGGVWIALFAGWGVRHYDPAGSLIETIRFPVANITKIAFGGPDLRTAYATTAAKGLSAEERAAQPLAGNLFAFDAAVPGQAITPIGPIGTTRLFR